jgi:hypothetical protein
LYDNATVHLFDVQFTPPLMKTSSKQLYGQAFPLQQIRRRSLILVVLSKNKAKAHDIADLDDTSDQIGMTCIMIQYMQAKRFVCSPARPC